MRRSGIASLLFISTIGGCTYGTSPDVGSELEPAAIAPARKASGSGSPDGSARVFFPNPIASTGDQSLTDEKDADYPALQPAYKTVALTDLDGSGFLSGKWAYVVSETGQRAFSATNSFQYNRSQDEFEQVMAYYWVTTAQRHLQSLGFGTGRRPVMMRPQAVRINQWGIDNSFQTNHPKDELRFGKGGVDDAEDADVILHEYGHAIQADQVAGFGSSLEAGSIGEGFGDYWAASVTDAVAPSADPGCVAEWDSVSYTSAPHCLRRVDGTKVYPTDVVGEVHADGEIWSSALWAIRGQLGQVKADTIIIESHFSFAPDTSFAAAALATVNAASTLYGGPAANAVRNAFQARGIL